MSVKHLQMVPEDGEPIEASKTGSPREGLRPFAVFAERDAADRHGDKPLPESMQYLAGGASDAATLSCVAKRGEQSVG
jgi:hypothetical protein